MEGRDPRICMERAVDRYVELSDRAPMTSPTYRANLVTALCDRLVAEGFVIVDSGWPTTADASREGQQRLLCGTCGDRKGVVCDLCGNGLVSDGERRVPFRRAALREKDAG